MMRQPTRRPFPAPTTLQLYAVGWILGLISYEALVPAAAGFCFLLLFAGRRFVSFSRLSLLLLFFLIGRMLTGLVLPQPPATMPKAMATKEPVVFAADVETVEGKLGRRLRIVLDDIEYTDAQGRSGSIREKAVLSWRKPTFRPLPGERITGILRFAPVHGFGNPGTWDIEKYWAQRGVLYRAYSEEDRAGIRGTAQRAGGFVAARDSLRRQTVQQLSEASDSGEISSGGAILIALLFGDRYYLDPDLYAQFRQAGLAHSLALSGLHLGMALILGWIAALIIGGVVPQVYLWLPRPKAAVAAALLPAAGYLWLGYGSPSLLRAFLMYLFFMIFLLRNRERVILDALFWAVTVILILSPLSIFDLRLQLSATAVFGVIVYVQGIRRPLYNLLHDLKVKYLLKGFEDPEARRLKHRSMLVSEIRARLPVTVGKIVLDLTMIQLVVQSVSLPLVLMNFGTLTPSFGLNLIWLPLLGLVILPLGFLGVIVNGFGPAVLGKVLVLGSAGVIQGFVSLLELCTSQGLMPEWLSLRPTALAAVGYWGLVLCCLVLVFHKQSRSALRMKLAVVLALILLFIPVAQRAVQYASDVVRLRVVDVGHGLCCIVDIPHGRRLIIDGGGVNSDRFDIGRAVVSKILTENRSPAVERIILTHPHRDHLGGLFYLLQTYDVRSRAYNGRLPDWMDREETNRTFRNPKKSWEVWRAGHVEELGNGIRLEILHPPKGFSAVRENDHGLCLRLTRNGKGLVLIPADLEQHGLHGLMRNADDLSADVLLLPHHGSKSAYSPELYDKVSPQLAVASTGYLNQWNMPNPAVRQSLARKKILLLGTPEHGMIDITWEPDGSGPRVETYRQGRWAILSE